MSPAPAGYGAGVAGRHWVPLRSAWEAALYGRQGFYRRESPADHFETSPHASDLFALAVVELARRLCLSRIVDVGAGSGRLLAGIAAVAPEIDLVGVDLRARPEGLPARVHWYGELPGGVDRLVLANEVLDNIACDVVEVDDQGQIRHVEVDAATGDQRLGEPARAELLEWTTRWWPLTECGSRAEVGLTRDSWWSSLCAAASRGACVAVDYGHLAGDRPRLGTLTSYRRGAQVPVTFDGTSDVTAHVAFDSLAAAVGGMPRTQRDVLRELGVSGRRPPLQQATTDPAGYLRALALAGEAAELTTIGGLGDLYWLIPDVPW